MKQIPTKLYYQNFKPSTVTQPMTYEEYLVLKNDILPEYIYRSNTGEHQEGLYHRSSNTPIKINETNRYFIIWSPVLNQELQFKTQNVIAVALNLIDENTIFPVYILSNVAKDCRLPETFTLAYTEEDVKQNQKQMTGSKAFLRENPYFQYPHPLDFTPPSQAIEVDQENKLLYIETDPDLKIEITPGMETIETMETINDLPGNNNIQPEETNNLPYPYKLNPKHSPAVQALYKQYGNDIELYEYPEFNHDPKTLKVVRPKTASPVFELLSPGIHLILESLFPTNNKNHHYKLTSQAFYEDSKRIATLTILKVFTCRKERKSNPNKPQLYTYKNLSFEPNSEERSLQIVFKKFAKSHLKGIIRKKSNKI